MMQAGAHSKILKACYSFLLPVARFLLRAGISFREFEELARLAFVQVSSEEYGLRGRPTNISRISAMTGIPRKEVSKIREHLAMFQAFPRKEISPLGDILHHWHTDPEYIDSEGNPRPLHLTKTAPSFESLARKYGGDLPVGALRVELVRTGAARLRPDGLLQAEKRVAIPDAIDDKLITSLSFNLFGLASTIAHNSDPDRDSEGRIERFVQSDRISEAATKRLRSQLRKRIELFTEEVDDVFSAVNSKESGDYGRVGIGIYFFEDDSAP